jgi:hypothetical protein
MTQCLQCSDIVVVMSCNIIALVTYIYNFIYGDLCHCNSCNSSNSTKVGKLCWIASLVAKHLFSHSVCNRKWTSLVPIKQVQSQVKLKHP